MTSDLSFWTGTGPHSPTSAHLPGISGALAPGEAFGRHHRVLRARCLNAIKNRQILKLRAQNPRWTVQEDCPTASPPLQSPPALFPPRSICPATPTPGTAAGDRAPVADARPRWAVDRKSVV